jgi:acetate kinase
MLCKSLGRLGVVGDEDRNQKTIRGVAGPISADNSQLPVWVIPTNEELMIARDARAIAAGEQA